MSEKKLVPKLYGTWCMGTGELVHLSQVPPPLDPKEFSIRLVTEDDNLEGVPTTYGGTPFHSMTPDYSVFATREEAAEYCFLKGLDESGILPTNEAVDDTFFALFYADAGTLKGQYAKLRLRPKNDYHGSPYGKRLRDLAEHYRHKCSWWVGKDDPKSPIPWSEDLVPPSTSSWVTVPADVKAVLPSPISMGARAPSLRDRIQTQGMEDQRVFDALDALVDRGFYLSRSKDPWNTDLEKYKAGTFELFKVTYDTCKTSYIFPSTVTSKEELEEHFWAFDPVVEVFDANTLGSTAMPMECAYAPQLPDVIGPKGCYWNTENGFVSDRLQEEYEPGDLLIEVGLEEGESNFYGWLEPVNGEEATVFPTLEQALFGGAEHDIKALRGRHTNSFLVPLGEPINLKREPAEGYVPLQRQNQFLPIDGIPAEEVPILGTSRIPYSVVEDGPHYVSRDLRTFPYFDAFDKELRFTRGFASSDLIQHFGSLREGVPEKEVKPILVPPVTSFEPRVFMKDVNTQEGNVTTLSKAWKAYVAHPKDIEVTFLPGEEVYWDGKRVLTFRGIPLDASTFLFKGVWGLQSPKTDPVVSYGQKGMTFATKDEAIAYLHKFEAMGCAPSHMLGYTRHLDFSSTAFCTRKGLLHSPDSDSVLTEGHEGLVATSDIRPYPLDATMDEDEYPLHDTLPQYELQNADGELVGEYHTLKDLTSCYRRGLTVVEKNPDPNACWVLGTSVGRTVVHDLTDALWFVSKHNQPHTLEPYHKDTIVKKCWTVDGITSDSELPGQIAEEGEVPVGYTTLGAIQLPKRPPVVGNESFPYLLQDCFKPTYTVDGMKGVLVKDVFDGSYREVFEFESQADAVALLLASADSVRVSTSRASRGALHFSEKRPTPEIVLVQVTNTLTQESRVVNLRALQERYPWTPHYTLLTPPRMMGSLTGTLLTPIYREWTKDGWNENTEDLQGIHPITIMEYRSTPKGLEVNTTLTSFPDEPATPVGTPVTEETSSGAMLLGILGTLAVASGLARGRSTPKLRLGLTPEAEPQEQESESDQQEALNEKSS